MTCAQMTNLVVERDDCLVAALAYARRGWRVVPAVGKAPQLKKWGERASTDEACVRTMWRGRQKYNVAIATGSGSGIWVLDVDGEAGANSLAALEARHGTLPPTVTAITGGGKHLYFSMPDRPIRNTVKQLGPGLDTRSDGGCVIAPPSIHPSGAIYRWERGRSPLDLAVADTPDWLLNLIAPAETARVAKFTASSYPAGLSAMSAAIRAAPNGQQETTLNSMAFRAGSLVKRGWVDERAAYGALVQAALAMPNYRPTEPWTAAQLEKKVSEALKAGIEKGLGGFHPMGGSAPQPSDVQDLAALPHTDTGNGFRFAILCGELVRYVPGMGWIAWTGTHWKRDEEGRVVALAQQVASAIGQESQLEAAVKWSKQSAAKARIDAMIEMAKPHMVVSIDELDASKDLLNLANGTFDLAAGKFQPHRPSDFSTKVSLVTYDPTARCPIWERFVTEIFGADQDLIRFVKRAAGYSLTGKTSEQVMFILCGNGSNGKSTFVDTIMKGLGDYAQQAPSSLVLAKGNSDGVPNDVARLRGARFVSMSEIDGGRALSESLVKQLTGQDRVTARFLRQEFFEFEPVLKLWMATNHEPEVKGTDEGIWRRLRLIPFNVQFLDATQASTGQPVRDPDLRNKLHRELPGILNWMISGAAEWSRGGLGLPATVMAATAEYRQEMDHIQGFLDSKCDVEKALSTPASELYSAYQAYCRESGEDYVSKHRFKKALSGKRIFSLKTGGLIVYRGLSLRRDAKGGEGASAGQPETEF